MRQTCILRRSVPLMGRASSVFGGFFRLRGNTTSGLGQCPPRMCWYLCVQLWSLLSLRSCLVFLSSFWYLFFACFGSSLSLFGFYLSSLSFVHFCSFCSSLSVLAVVIGSIFYIWCVVLWARATSALSLPALCCPSVCISTISGPPSHVLWRPHSR